MIPTNSQVRGIVERVRAGDQVAMAIMCQVRDRAAKGDAKAKQSQKLFAAYLKKNKISTMGDEVSDITNPKAFQDLWTAHRETPANYAIVVAKASPFVQVWQAVVAIVHGPKLTKDNPLMQTVNVKDSRLANIVRRAFMIQRIQRPNYPISSYCPATGWELGE